MYGLVLEGGGAKGAYEIGACKALLERGYTFSAVVGTSIGAINGSMIVQGRIKEAEEAWKTNLFPEAESFNYFYKLSLVDFFQEDFSLDKIKRGFENLKTNVSNMKPLEIAPLEKFINENISEEEMRKSKIKFGLATVNVSDKETQLIFLDDMKKGELKKYLLATCYLPFFKSEPLDGKYYLDGGLFNRLPFEMLQDMGLPLIIVRVNKPEIWDKKIPEGSIVIGPKKKIAGVMEFDTGKAKELLKWGYLDALKVLDNLGGEDFYIERPSENKAINILNKLFMEKKSVIEEIASLNSSSIMRKLYEDVYPKLGKELGLESIYTYSDLLMALTEAKAEELKLDSLRVYSIEELLSACFAYSHSYEDKSVGILNKSLNTALKKLFIS